MARRPQGWKLRLPTGAKSYSVRYWSAAERRQIELGTGESDPGRAAKRAAQIYAEAVRGQRKPSRRRPCVAAPLSTLATGARWLQASKGLLDDKTIAVYSIYVETHLAPAFPSLLDVEPASVRKYQTTRLAQVQASTVRHELSCLRCLLRWAQESRLLSEVPDVPGVPKRAQGKVFGKRRRVKPDELTVTEVLALIAALPTKSARIGPVRARFELAYEMALRPETLDRLSVPEHWRPGRSWLTLSAGAMKGRRESRKRLTRRAQEILEAVAPKSGLVFGKHDYRPLVAAAATAALPKEKAKTFAAAHLRSAAITHFLDGGAPLTAAQAFADHKHATTTDRYVRASERALEDELRKQGKL